jgi:alkylhydroperoxidase family enzyme
MVKTQGRSSPATVQSFLDAGFQEKDMLCIVLAIAVKTLSNYSNHAFATPVDAVFAAYRVD